MPEKVVGVVNKPLTPICRNWETCTDDDGMDEFNKFYVCSSCGWVLMKRGRKNPNVNRRD